jgi:hypothetical protein
MKKITAYPIPTAAVPNPQAVVLGDRSTGEYISNYKPKETRQVQVEEYPGAQVVDVFDRGNRNNFITFYVDRFHETDEAATNFVNTHARSVPVKADVEIEGPDTTNWLAGAAITNVEVVRNDNRSTVFSYTIIGGDWVTARPTR